MKTTSMQMAGLLAGSLLMGSAADAAFTGFEGVRTDKVFIQGQLWDVWRVYATFDDPGDALEIVSGNPANPLSITSSGTFYQELQLGADIEHNALLEAIFPDLAFDSYVTINSTDSNQGTATGTLFISGNWGPSALTLTNGGWFRVPGDPLTLAVPTPGGNLGVLIGQFTVESDERLNGTVNLFARINGDGQEINGATFSFPGPGGCCLPNLSCQNNVIAENCEAAGGEFIGQGTSCSTTACNGACCFDAEPPLKGCAVVSEADCLALPGGIFLGSGSPCTAQLVVMPIHTATQWTHVIAPVSLCPQPEIPEGVGGCVEHATKVDAWMTADDGASCEDFSSIDACPIPAGFFGTGSDEYIQPDICFIGEPIGQLDILGLGVIDYGEADTLVARSADPFDRCTLPGGPPQTVDIEIVALNLVSEMPITVTYGGLNPELWDVRVALSDTEAQPGGQLTATKDHCNGGMFDSTLAACPKFIFTRVSDGTELELDYCATCNSAGISMTSNGQDWVHDPDAALGLDTPVCSAFHPGLQERVQTQACDCNGNGVRDKCDIEDGFRDCDNNGIPDACEAPSSCPEDTDCNLAVDVDDLVNVILSWNCTGAVLPCVGDVDSSGTVDVDDLVAVILAWGPC